MFDLNDHVCCVDRKHYPVYMLRVKIMGNNFNREKILVEREFYNGSVDDGRPLYQGKTRSSFLDELNKLNIDNWDEKYDDPDRNYGMIYKILD